MTKPDTKKPFLTPLITFLEEHWGGLEEVYGEIYEDFQLGLDEAEAVYQWLREQEGLK